MDLLQDSSHTMWGLNVRLKDFMEQVSRLQEANRQLEAQIADWGARISSRGHNWTQQEQIAKELRSQICELLMENAQLALQSNNMKSRAAEIQTRCEMEERNTRRLEQQVAQLREAKRRADVRGVTLQDECHRAMTQLHHMDQEFQARAPPRKLLPPPQENIFWFLLSVTPTSSTSPPSIPLIPAD
ncbi:type I cytoskeletal 24-like [Nothobranchius furzeri]|uniref:Type I cytoskeletal 24-like n=1 Tax=Nothobranchius furzeri TaxID=105023 RepID=A0A9D2Y9L6_NOTFU|nr:type I cytoskeletal 24-like [Nothobranchius furzeri]